MIKIPCKSKKKRRTKALIRGAIKDETAAPRDYAKLVRSMRSSGYPRSKINKVKKIIGDERRHKRTLKGL